MGPGLSSFTIKVMRLEVVVVWRRSRQRVGGGGFQGGVDLQGTSLVTFNADKNQPAAPVRTSRTLEKMTPVQASALVVLTVVMASAPVPPPHGGR